MYKIIYMKADFEPWWKFEGWEAHIMKEYRYATKEEFEIGLKDMLNKFRNQYDHEASKEGKYFAFWTENEKIYCEACDEEVQIFHGIIAE